MKSETPSPGSVFVSYAKDDKNRVAPLVRWLASAGFDVWWDRDIELGASFRSAIQNSLNEAACVVVVWTIASVDRDFVRSEASIGQAQGILVPVLLDAGARIPVGFTELQYLDLTRWDGTEAPELQRLADRIRSLAARGPSKVRYQATLGNSDWLVTNSQHIITELRGLTTQIRSVGELLTSGSPSVKDLRAALGEVSKTYYVVNAAIRRFTAPVVGTGAIEATPFLEIERGTIRAEIENGRGHCGLVLTHYGRYGGLRDSIKDRLSPEQLTAVDDAFARA